ncbi:unnamed protein product [Didymodactylos carnosus]|uniref:Uncharacterized protein n=1 Tax=Didymodactylos carnosus TaxID=1234261 RepID=A0A815W3H3_9BILA|nr:unnamed protein product [Didymodactylos carnosus]CAF1536951.1 unnamed protein product [Didymodactylos carnosus]CAF3767891.1 unnamed protein product [Didymodactylos carnosus]CAF4396844.1 unnamed protein product [Didymodactylos carnosus]
MSKARQPTADECVEKGREYFKSLGITDEQLGEHVSSLLKLAGDKEIRKQPQAPSEENALKMRWLKERNLNLNPDNCDMKEKLKWIDAK